MTLPSAPAQRGEATSYDEQLRSALDGAPESACSCGWSGDAAEADAHACPLPEPADDLPCPICSVPMATEVDVIAHVGVADGVVHILRWIPPSWSVFGGEVVFLLVGGDDQPLNADELRLVGQALLDAASYASQ